MTTTVKRLIGILQELPEDEVIIWQYIQKDHYDKELTDDEWEAIVDKVDDSRWADEVSTLTFGYCEDFQNPDDDEEGEDEEEDDGAEVAA